MLKSTVLPIGWKILCVFFVSSLSFYTSAQLHAPVSCEGSSSFGSLQWSTTPSGSSQFDWTPAGALTNSFTNISGTGVDATITFTGETATFGVWGGTQTPSIGTNPTGGTE
ncbi:MAG: hypothetical protein AB8B56_07325 [Crocinitomicaceae bacterium]